jgi:hypothetical protein
MMLNGFRCSHGYAAKSILIHRIVFSLFSKNIIISGQQDKQDNHDSWNI